MKENETKRTQIAFISLRNHFVSSTHHLSWVIILVMISTLQSCTTENISFNKKENALKIYHVSKQKLEKTLGIYQKLEKLDISYTDLDKFELQSENLRTLVLSRVELDSIPDWIFRHQRLEKLEFSKNNLEIIPESINQLENLAYLDVSWNKLTDIPLSLGKIKKLRMINVTGNPLPYNAIEKFRKSYPNITVMHMLDLGVQAKPQFQLNYAIISHQKGKFVEAQHYYNLVLHKIPQHSNALINKGIIHFELQEFEQALTVFEYLTKLEPNKAEHFYNKGIAELYLNNIDAACKSWLTALKMGYEKSNELLATYCK